MNFKALFINAYFRLNILNIFTITKFITSTKFLSLSFFLNNKSYEYHRIIKLLYINFCVKMSDINVSYRIILVTLKESL